MFHASISAKAKAEILEEFRTGSVRIVVSTIAFGMGIDIPDVHGVVVYHVPTTIGQLYQEVGRAGRNGEQASAAIFHGKADLKKAAKDVTGFIQNKGCLREELLKCLGQEMQDQPEQCCNTEEDDIDPDDPSYSTFIFLSYTGPQPDGNQRPRPIYQKRRQDTHMGNELKDKLRELRDEWYVQRPELLLFGPEAIMAEETITSIESKCRSIHSLDDLNKINGIPEDKGEEILGAINQLFPEEQRRTARARRRRGRGVRGALQDITNIQ
ncbi:ATP-dependent RNA helicase ddx24-like [Branchiostoma floridae]|nr:ATP-dependent RNA helicase ddx24-like [Branchiostoma floridae]